MPYVGGGIFFTALSVRARCYTAYYKGIGADKFYYLREILIICDVSLLMGKNRDYAVVNSLIKERICLYK